MTGYITKTATAIKEDYKILGSLCDSMIAVNNASDIAINNDAAVAFDGELYGITDHSCIDCNKPAEEILNLYKNLGPNLFKKLNGTFAIIVFDKARQSVLLVRDHIGLSSLYYSKNEEMGIFSNDFKWMMDNVASKSINRYALFQYMFNLYTLAPGTIINEIKKVRPASFMEWSINEKEKEVKYWNIEEIYLESKQNQILDFNECKNLLKDLIKDAISIRYKPTKTGVMLSSGIDSSLVSSIAAELYKSDVQTITIGVKEKRYNESDVAREISNHLGIRNTTLWMDNKLMFAQIDKIIEAFPEPMGDSGAIPNIFLAESASEKYEYIMGGDGGDEIFSGYPHYKIVDIAQKFDRIGLILHRFLPQNIKNKLPSGVRRIIDNRSEYNKTQVILQTEVEKINRFLNNKISYIGDSKENPAIKSWRDRRMVHDIQTSLVDEMVYKAVCCSKYAGIKVLSPLLDYRVIELACKIPLKYKYTSAGITKHILRQIDYDFIPKHILDVPKRGFVIPIETMLREYSKSIKRFIDKDYLERQNLFNYAEIKRIVDSFIDGDNSHYRTIWLFYEFQLWYEKYFQK